MRHRILRRPVSLTGLPAALIGSLALGVGAASPAAAAEPAIAEPSGHRQPLHPTPGPATAAPTSHTVRQGDTVWGIATRHGLRPADVLAWNGLDRSSTIHPGQVLTLRAPEGAAVAPPSAPATSTYTIVRGDTVWSIATRHGVTVNAVLGANGLTRASIIYPGQTLQIPGKTAPAGATAAAAHTALDAEQQQNARIIVAVGRELGVSDRGIAIALGTAMVESWLRNLDWGDRDSLGLFQQRPSTGWGTPGQVRDPDRAARVFFGGPHDPNGSRTRGLLDVPGWQEMSFAQAAQAVQVSAYPDRYARWESDAYAWLAALG